MHLNDMAEQAYEMSADHGFHADDDNPLSIPAKLALIHSEVSEALEDHRKGRTEMYFEPDGKPCGFPSELADIAIRLGDIAWQANVDLNEAVKAKMTYNKGRPFMHGEGKRY